MDQNRLINTEDESGSVRIGTRGESRPLKNRDKRSTTLQTTIEGRRTSGAGPHLPGICQIYRADLSETVGLAFRLSLCNVNRSPRVELEDAKVRIFDLSNIGHGFGSSPHKWTKNSSFDGEDFMKPFRRP
jgi:hypothetical protein